MQKIGTSLKLKERCKDSWGINLDVPKQKRISQDKIEIMGILLILIPIQITVGFIMLLFHYLLN